MDTFKDFYRKSNSTHIFIVTHHKAFINSTRSREIDCDRGRAQSVLRGTPCCPRANAPLTVVLVNLHSTDQRLGSIWRAQVKWQMGQKREKCLCTWSSGQVHNVGCGGGVLTWLSCCSLGAGGSPAPWCWTAGPRGWRWTRSCRWCGGPGRRRGGAAGGHRRCQWRAARWAARSPCSRRAGGRGEDGEGDESHGSGFSGETQWWTQTSAASAAWRWNYHLLGYISIQGGKSFVYLFYGVGDPPYFMTLELWFNGV